MSMLVSLFPNITLKSEVDSWISNVSLASSAMSSAIVTSIHCIAPSVVPVEKVTLVSTLKKSAVLAVGDKKTA